MSSLPLSRLSGEMGHSHTSSEQLWITEPACSARRSNGGVGTGVMTKRRVLVIEDDGLLALDLCDTLERVGLEVVGVATNVKDALRLAKDRWPDVAIVDVRLSGRRDGIDAAHLLREQRDIGLVFL